MAGPSVVAAQLASPKRLTEAPLLVASIKDFNVMAHSEAEWPSKQNIPIFYFALFHYFLVPFADTFSSEPPPGSLQFVASCLCRGVRHSENLYLNHNTVFASCANYKQNLQIVRINYKIITYFPADTRKRLVVCN